MTRKDYIAIAAAFKIERDDALLHNNSEAYGYLCATAARVADVFEADNPHFDRDRFMQAAGFPPAATTGD